MKTVCVAMSAHHTDSVPAFGTTMANRAPQFNWTHSRNPVSANDMSASWNKELYRGRPSAQLPQAPLAESLRQHSWPLRSLFAGTPLATFAQQFCKFYEFLEGSFVAVSKPIFASKY